MDNLGQSEYAKLITGRRGAADHVPRPTPYARDVPVAGGPPIHVVSERLGLEGLDDD